MWSITHNWRTSALCLLFLFIGCNNNNSDIADACVPFDHAFVCSLDAGGAIVGGGVVLYSSKFPDKGILVTARHVVTFNRNYLSSMAVSVTKQSKITLGDTKTRWLTVKDNAVDAAWMLLNAAEMKEIKKSGIKHPIAIPKNLSLNKSDDVKIVNTYNSFNSKYIDELTIQCPLPENLHLTHVTLVVGMVNVAVSKNNSGSPVFMRKDDRNFLIGTVAISRKNPDATGFIDIRQYLDSIVDIFNGKTSVRLVNCQNLW
jgi:hypothetical protein